MTRISLLLIGTFAIAACGAKETGNNADVVMSVEENGEKDVISINASGAGIQMHVEDTDGDNDMVSIDAPGASVKVNSGDITHGIINKKGDISITTATGDKINVKANKSGSYDDEVEFRSGGAKSNH